MNVFSLQEVTVKRGNKALLDKVSWQVNEGERWVVLGPNGAGKTTLVQLLAGRLYPTQGEVTIVGEKLGQIDLQQLRPIVGVASSAVDEKIDKDATVLNIVLASAYGYLSRGHENYEHQDQIRAHEILNKFQIAHLADRRYGTLSTGEKKRVQIARALMSNPEILLLDEATSGLDLRGREEIIADLSNFAADEYAPVLVLVTHHVEEIPSGFTHLLMLKEGVVSAKGELAATLSEENLSLTFDIPIHIIYEAGRWSARIVR